MTTTLTKADFAAKLAEAGKPLTKSQIKNTTLADLAAQVEAIVVDVQMPGAAAPKQRRPPLSMLATNSGSAGKTAGT